jgi:hypothetical protein
MRGFGDNGLEVRKDGYTACAQCSSCSTWMIALIPLADRGTYWGSAGDEDGKAALG